MNEHAPSDPRAPRSVRSFVRRSGRLTEGQQRALERLAPQWALPADGPAPDLDALFGRHAPRVLEIGFGDGEALLAMAGRLPDTDFLGIEVHEPGVGHLLLGIEKLGLTNVRVLCTDAVEAVQHRLPARGFAAVKVLFPDPWPKKRHHKRRLIQAPFVDALARLQPGGAVLHLATDWAPYAEWMREVMDGRGDYRPMDAAAVAAEPLAWRPDTKFERRGLKLGHEVTDLHYRRVDGGGPSARAADAGLAR